jgi:hypothetical protein
MDNCSNVGRYIDLFIRTNITALELNCSVTYDTLVDVGHIYRYRPAFHKLEICIMRSYPIKSKLALFN